MRLLPETNNPGHAKVNANAAKKMRNARKPATQPKEKDVWELKP